MLHEWRREIERDREGKGKIRFVDFDQHIPGWDNIGTCIITEKKKRESLRQSLRQSTCTSCRRLFCTSVWFHLFHKSYRKVHISTNG